MSVLQTILAFLAAIGPLIIFHELGHYAVARLCGVKVLRFSVGMGKVVWSRRFGKDQTEWAVSMLPLGGYVKFLDSREEGCPPLSEADKLREFTRQNVWKRIAIVAAGPVANFLLAIILLSGLYMVGVAEPSTRVRAAPEKSVAALAGIARGDSIHAVNGLPVKGWSDLRMAILEAALDKGDIRLDVERGDGGNFVAVLPAASVKALGVEGDVLSRLGFNLWLPPLKLGKVIEGQPAAQAGLQPGDIITEADGKPIADGADFVAAVRAGAGRPMVVQGQRNGDAIMATLTPAYDAANKRHMAGIEMVQPIETVTIVNSPLDAIAKGSARTRDTAVLTVRLLWKMATLELSLRNISGPLAMADAAGQTARMGLEVFLGFIAFVSISLGVMNLLPIPVLDGGLLLYYSVEVLTGRPLPERIGDFAQRAGVGLLVMLMALAVFNDVAQRFDVHHAASVLNR